MRTPFRIAVADVVYKILWWPCVVVWFPFGITAYILDKFNDFVQNRAMIFLAQPFAWFEDKCISKLCTIIAGKPATPTVVTKHDY